MLLPRLAAAGQVTGKGEGASPPCEEGGQGGDCAGWGTVIGESEALDLVVAVWRRHDSCGERLRNAPRLPPN